MLKDASYHRAAIQYNEELAEFAEELSGRLEHEEVARWSGAVSRQHKFHAGRHKRALSKIEKGEEVVEDDDVDEVSHRSAETGQFVSEEFAEQNPSTTVSETVPKAGGDIHSPFEVKSVDASPDPTQAAEPVDNQGESA